MTFLCYFLPFIHVSEFVVVRHVSTGFDFIIIRKIFFMQIFCISVPAKEGSNIIERIAASRKQRY
jgi:hypothetical protein